jgi:hypothetical protein
MTSLSLFLKDTVIVIPLGSWDPISENIAYRKLLDKDIKTLEEYLNTQSRYIDTAKNKLEKKKLERGLELILRAIREKKDVEA